MVIYVTLLILIIVDTIIRFHDKNASKKKKIILLALQILICISFCSSIYIFATAYNTQIVKDTISNPVISGNGNSILFYINKENKGGALYYCDRINRKHRFIDYVSYSPGYTIYAINYKGDICAYPKFNGMYTYSIVDRCSNRILLSDNKPYTCGFPKFYDKGQKLMFIASENNSTKINKKRVVSYSLITNKTIDILYNDTQLVAENADISDDGSIIIFEKDKSIWCYNTNKKKMNRIGAGYYPKISYDGKKIIYTIESRYNSSKVVLEKQDNGQYENKIVFNNYFCNPTTMAINDKYIILNFHNGEGMNGFYFYDKLNEPVMIIPMENLKINEYSGVSIDKDSTYIAITGRGLTMFEYDKYPMLYIYNLKKKKIMRLISSWEIDRCLKKINLQGSD